MVTQFTRSSSDRAHDHPCGFPTASPRLGLALVTASVIALLGLAFGTPCVATAPAAEIAPPQRVLEFPADRSIGMVAIRPFRDRPLVDDLYEAFVDHVPARGAVQIPAAHEVELWISAEAAGDMSFLSKLPSDSIQSLSLWRSRAEDPQIQHIAHLTGLKQIRMEDCRFTPAGLTGLAPLVNLEILDLDAYIANHEVAADPFGGGDPFGANADPFGLPGAAATGIKTWRYGFNDQAMQVLTRMPKLKGCNRRSAGSIWHFAKSG